MEEWRKRFLSAAIVVCLLAAMVIISREVPVFAALKDRVRQRPCVVLDAGHGGDDPGKIGVGGVLEKDINLSIAMRLRDYLEQQDVTVVMTREKDEMLSGEGGGKKAADMKRRVEIINEAKADLTVSIHQNSYPSPAVHGAQVFFYKDSEQGQTLAAVLQENLRETVDPDNRRQIKENTNYYLLKKTTLPIAIVECGFLSNPEEAAMLGDEEYQDRIAWAVCKGILQYLADENGSSGH